VVTGILVLASPAEGIGNELVQLIALGEAEVFSLRASLCDE
jgi:hypothetical protein